MRTCRRARGRACVRVRDWRAPAPGVTMYRCCVGGGHNKIYCAHHHNPGRGGRFVRVLRASGRRASSLVSRWRSAAALIIDRLKIDIASLAAPEEAAGKGAWNCGRLGPGSEARPPFRELLPNSCPGQPPPGTREKLLPPPLQQKRGGPERMFLSGPAPEPTARNPHPSSSPPTGAGCPAPASLLGSRTSAPRAATGPAGGRGASHPGRIRAGFGRAGEGIGASRRRSRVGGDSQVPASLRASVRAPPTNMACVM